MPTPRIYSLLTELEARVERARQHEKLMAQAKAESAGWSQPEDREWARAAHIDAQNGVVEAERTLAEGREIALCASEGVSEAAA